MRINWILGRLGWEKIHQKYTLQVILPLEVAKTALLQFGRNHQEGVLRYSAKYLSSSKSLVWQKMGSLEKTFYVKNSVSPTLFSCAMCCYKPNPPDSLNTMEKGLF